PMTMQRALGVTRVLSADRTAAAPAVSVASVAPVAPVQPDAVPTTLGSSASSLERSRGDRLRLGLVLGAAAIVGAGAFTCVRLGGGGAHVGEVKTAADARAIAPASAAGNAPAGPAGTPGVDAPSAIAVDAGAPDAAAPRDAMPAIDAGAAVDAASRST